MNSPVSCNLDWYDLGHSGTFQTPLRNFPTSMVVLVRLGMMETPGSPTSTPMTSSIAMRNERRTAFAQARLIGIPSISRVDLVLQQWKDTD
jgi:hypothetical protein